MSNAPNVFKNTHANCNDATENIAPAIPFAHPEKMAQWLREPKQRGRLQEKILSTEEAARMPPTRMLTDRELNGILNYLSGF